MATLFLLPARWIVLANVEKICPALKFKMDENNKNEKQNSEHLSIGLYLFYIGENLYNKFPFLPGKRSIYEKKCLNAK